MDNEAMIAVAKKYVASSNKHDASECCSLMHADAEYVSSSVGQFKGTPDIENMMKQYFEKFPNVHWEVPEYVLTGNCVSFKFIRTGCASADGYPITAHGFEEIILRGGSDSSSPLISKIKVETMRTVEHAD